MSSNDPDMEKLLAELDVLKQKCDDYEQQLEHLTKQNTELRRWVAILKNLMRP